MKYSEVNGNLIELALKGEFDVIAHGCNCFCVMGAGIAPQMAETFNCDKYNFEHSSHRGDHNKLGQIEYHRFNVTNGKVRPSGLFAKPNLAVVNAYTQYGFGPNHPNGTKIPLDYQALILCMRKINMVFTGKHIGLPQIGCGLAGGDWSKVKSIIQHELKDCKVTVVIYELGYKVY